MVVVGDRGTMKIGVVPGSKSPVRCCSTKFFVRPPSATHEKVVRLRFPNSRSLVRRTGCEYRVLHASPLAKRRFNIAQSASPAPRIRARIPSRPTVHQGSGHSRAGTRPYVERGVDGPCSSMAARRATSLPCRPHPTSGVNATLRHGITSHCPPATAVRAQARPR